MTIAVVDDHLLRDVLVRDQPASLRRLLAGAAPATTNLYYLRLCRGLATARGGRLTRSLPDEPRRALARVLASLPDEIAIVPMRHIAFRVAELADAHRLSALGAEAVAAAEHLGGTLVVWRGDDGPLIRAAAKAEGVHYRTIAR